MGSGLFNSAFASGTEQTPHLLASWHFRPWLEARAKCSKRQVAERRSRDVESVDGHYQSITEQQWTGSMFASCSCLPIAVYDQ